MRRHVLGVGDLNWDRFERISDRYGFVNLSGAPLNRMDPGERGRLFAEVIETRTSNHIGDLARGIYPSTPGVGERLLLGVGTLIYSEPNRDGTNEGVGIKPDDGRLTDWLDPQALYRAHSQRVRLVFEAAVA